MLTQDEEGPSKVECSSAIRVVFGIFEEINRTVDHESQVWNENKGHNDPPDKGTKDPVHSVIAKQLAAGDEQGNRKCCHEGHPVSCVKNFSQCFVIWSHHIFLKSKVTQMYF